MIPRDGDGGVTADFITEHRWNYSANLCALRQSLALQRRLHRRCDEAFAARVNTPDYKTLRVEHIDQQS